MKCVLSETTAKPPCLDRRMHVAKQTYLSLPGRVAGRASEG